MTGLAKLGTREALEQGAHRRQDFRQLGVGETADGIAESTFGKSSQSVRAYLAARAQSASPQIGRA